MKDDNTFEINVIKLYVKEYKRTKQTVRLPLSIFDPDMTENIYITYYLNDLERRREHLIQSQGMRDDWIEERVSRPRGIFEFKLNDPITELCKNIHTYAVENEIREVGKEVA